MQPNMGIGSDHHQTLTSPVNQLDKSIPKLNANSTNSFYSNGVYNRQNHTVMNSNSKKSFFPSIGMGHGVDDSKLRRDHSLLTASRDTLKKQLSFIKLYHKFQEVSQQSESISKRRYLVNDILTNWSRYPSMRN